MINVDNLSLSELNKLNWELNGQELAYNEAMKHPKFEKLKPKPTLGAAFVELRNRVKQAIESKKNAN